MLSLAFLVRVAVSPALRSPLVAVERFQCPVVTALLLVVGPRARVSQPRFVRLAGFEGLVGRLRDALRQALRLY